MIEEKERKHNSACEHATHKKCVCTCGGNLHGIKSNGIPEDPVKRMKYINQYYWLCEYSFVPFPHSEDNPEFALGADVYAQIPDKTAKKYKDRNHALAIWQDRTTKEWVVRKEFRQTQITTFALENNKIALQKIQGILQTNVPTGKWQDVYRGNDFQDALNMCTIYANKYWSFETEWKACTHESYMRSCCKPKEVKP